MTDSLKIAIIGDFNFTYNSHHATNLALEHTERFLETEINYYWIKLAEAINLKQNAFSNYDGIWFAPGPFSNEFFLSGILSVVLKTNLPILLTGESYKTLINLLIKQNNLNTNNEKLISDNLVEGNKFEAVKINAISEDCKRTYLTHSNIELTSSRYSLYPQLLEMLKAETISIEGVDQFNEPEIIRLSKHNYVLASMFCPQISSTREMPHPIVNSFIKSCFSKVEAEKLNK
jgi:CTP synthase (UTP-ammonia lyase)